VGATADTSQTTESGSAGLDPPALLALLEHVDDALLGLRFDGTVTFASPSVRTLLGWDERGMVGGSILDYLRPEAVGEITDALVRWQGRRGSVAGERVAIRALDGRWVDVVYQVTIDPRLGSLGDLVVTFRAADGWDEARLRLIERAYNEDRLVRLASTLVSHGPGRFQEGLDEAVAELAGLSWVTRVSVWRVSGDRVERRATWSARQGAPEADLPRRLPLDRVPRLAALEEVFAQPGRLPADSVGSSLTSSGVESVLAVAMSIGGRFTGFTMIETTFPGPVFEATHFATLRSASAVLAEAFERHDLERELAARANTDRLTSLPNRWSFDESLDAALAELAEGRSDGVAVMLMDVDRFKVVNDSLGHDAGDTVLVEVAQRLSSLVRQREQLDVAARLGGDEFVLLVPGCPTADDALAVAGDVIDALGPPFDVAGHAVPLTASVGVVHTRRTRAASGELLRRAEGAMYQAKTLGGGKVALEDRAERDRTSGRVRDEAELRAAIEGGQLAVHYQAEWNLASSALIGAEALVRWNHPRRGLMSAGEFIPLAEDCGLILPLGMQVLAEACRTVSGWSGDGLPANFVLRVNVSARQLLDEQLAEQIADVLRDTGLPPRQLCLELTESTLLADPAGAAVVLDRLRALGVGVAVDDFGTGFSSLLYLKQLPLTSLKIDRAFVEGVTEDPRDRAIVSAVTQLAREIGISATAEGVETPEQRDVLVELGCERAQGFLLSRPEPVEQFRRHLAAG
jgi:diguanylate cyclase (GGDEF)-like protein